MKIKDLFGDIRGRFSFSCRLPAANVTAMEMQSRCKQIAKPLQTDCKATANRLQNHCKEVAVPLQKDCSITAKRLHSFAVLIN
ncbi:hypothetical protein HU824_05780 [Bacteroides sp. L10-4]|uniref:hypothetical protein n=1 Tax=Bacteroides sp. L10-4 TaxID=2746063 RepID=UPI0015956CAA|nr:hypothetical protein [Bacteroides sp. L10-4]NVK92723.1 hypothetical protein [Bacteroides sp. L10-4]